MLILASIHSNSVNTAVSGNRRKNRTEVLIQTAKSQERELGAKQAKAHPVETSQKNMNHNNALNTREP